MQKNIFIFIALCALTLASFSPLFDSVARAQSATNPDSVNIAGTHQDELGCPGEWQPECENTLLKYDEEDDVWQGTFEIEPGNDDDKKGSRYKAASTADGVKTTGRMPVPTG